MSRSMQTLTLGVALGAAAFAGATFIGTADAHRHATAAESDIAFIDAFGLIDRIVMSPEDTEARVSFEARSQEGLQTLQNRNMEIQGLVQQNDPEDPANQGLIAEFQQNQQNLQNLYQQYQVEMQSMIAGQIAAAYKRIYEAADAVAAERGVRFIFVTRPDPDLLQVESITGVAQEILARPLIAPPASIDLTDAVRERLGLPEAAPDTDASPLTPADPAAATANPATPTTDDAGSEPDAEQE